VKTAQQGAPTTGSAPILGGHIPVLDGVRGLAILLVLIVHFGGSAADKALASGSIIERVYVRVVDTFGAGVDLFFVLSGFLITRILLGARGAPHALRSFYARRVLRIFPLYYFALFLVLVVLASFLSRPPPVETILHRQGWLWAYAGNVGSGLLDISWNEGWMRLDHFWSLAVEEHFYFFWPALALNLAPRKLARLCWVFFFSAIVIRLAFLGAGMRDASYQLTPCRLDALSLGALVAIASFETRTVERLLGGARVAMAVGLFGILAVAVLGHARSWLWWTTGAVHTSFAVFFVGLLVLVLASPEGARLSRAFRHPTLRTLGKYSYGLYVWHEILRPFLRNWVPVARLEAVLHSRLLGVCAYTVICTAASFAVAFTSWHVFEKQFLKFKDRVPYRSADAAVPARPDAGAAPAS